MTDPRPLRPADLPAVSRRLLAHSRADDFSPANLQRKVFDPGQPPELCCGVFEGDRCLAVLLGAVHGETGQIKLLTPEPRDAASRLLAGFEAHAKALGATGIDVTGAPDYFTPGIDPTDTVSLCCYLEHGYRRQADMFNMSVDLLTADLETADEEQQLAARDYRVARAEPGDRDAVRSFVQQHFSAGWRDETTLGYDFDPITIQLAWHDRSIVAFAAAEVTNPGWFGPTGTAPEHRRRGLGSTLLKRSLADLRELGYRQAEIGWVGPLAFYHKHCGAVVSRVFWKLRKDF